MRAHAMAESRLAGLRLLFSPGTTGEAPSGAPLATEQSFACSATPCPHQTLLPPVP